jgi:2-polyprenyl-6-methoxyphenol hydroxylase-like FAD-dependent oxidoreductase
MATSTKPITIVGGGLAGLTLGIGLRRRGVPTTLWEAGHYPRHRVCGEFICRRGWVLRELLERADAVGADTATFFSATQSGLNKPDWARNALLNAADAN